MSADFRIDFVTHAGEVLMVFPESYKFVHLSPALARDVGQKLIEMADSIDPPCPAGKKS